MLCLGGVTAAQRAAGFRETAVVGNRSDVRS